MRNINRYIFQNILVIFIVIVTIMTSLAWITQTLRYIPLIIEKDRSIFDFLSLTSLLYPWLLSLMAPSSLLIASVIVMDKMIRDSELVILNSSGISPYQKTLPFLKISILVTLLIYLFSIYITPWSMQNFREKITTIKSDIISGSFQENEFIHPDEDFTIFVADRNENGDFIGVIINDASDRKNMVTYSAKKAKLYSLYNQILLEMTDGKIFNANKDLLGEDMEIISFESYTINLSNVVTTAQKVYFKPSEKSIGELLNPINVPAEEIHRNIQYRNEAHIRLSNPLYTISFVFIALFFLQKDLNFRLLKSRYIVYVAGSCLLLKILGISISSKIKNYELYLIHYAIPISVILLYLLYIFSIMHRERKIKNANLY
ncbi:MAG: hypothetical protein CML98_02525 [Rhodobiaceae bacterium]|nr:hypothetical protein [Rhodobiaceae bacterium]